MPEEAIREYYDEALTLSAEQLINYFIKEIVLYDYKIEIRFNKSTRTSPDDNQGFSYYTDTVNNLARQGVRAFCFMSCKNSSITG